MTTPGRKPLPPVESNLPELVPNAGALMLADVNTVNDLEKDAVLAAGIDIGRLETTVFFTTIGESASVAIYENIKKSKAWKLLRNPESSDGRKFESLDDFCRVKLGKSYSRLQELTSNRRALGQDAFEQAERLGLRQVDYNAIKALPAPEQELMRRALEESATKADVFGVLQELASNHAKEKASFATQAEEANATLQAKDRVLADRAAQIQKLEEQTARKFKPRAGSDAKSLEEQHLMDEVDARTREANVNLRRLFLAADAAIEGSHSEAVQTRARQSIEWLAQQLAEIATEFGIVVNFEDMVKPPWLDEAALDAMEARQREQREASEKGKGKG